MSECPLEAKPATLECERGCGLTVLAKAETSFGVWRAGPWRLQVHNLIAAASGGRCPIPPIRGGR